ncbi:NYN domain-containing protein [Candidatus Poriferisodalis sp.]|uniref:NYN domain-containing protein n=1 Tax=Candidatus Poriferisodalis sp. TaxID=3101277 RepID=UPI003B524F43
MSDRGTSELRRPGETIVYIDGFNFYYGAVKGTPHKWLDFTALCQRLLPRDNIVKIRYFTARVSARPDDPQQADRQDTYLRALATLPSLEIHFGHFVQRKVRLPLTSPTSNGPRTVEVIKTEEKGSDVNLAAYLLRDAFTGRCGTAVVVSNDSDLREAVRIARIDAGVKVGIINPHPARYRSQLLRGTFFKQLRPNVLAQCQLPAVLHDDRGTIRKPASW